MFDFVPESALSGFSAGIDQHSLDRMLQDLSDDELSALEDDLDFCSFAGVPSERILSILSEMIELDAGWSRQLRKRSNPSIPTVY